MKSVHHWWASSESVRGHKHDSQRTTSATVGTITDPAITLGVPAKLKALMNQTHFSLQSSYKSSLENTAREMNDQSTRENTAVTQKRNR